MAVWIKLVTDHCIILTWYSKVCNGLKLFLVLHIYIMRMQNRKYQIK
jgi:hypothetical protein